MITSVMTVTHNYQHL